MRNEKNNKGDNMKTANQETKEYSFLNEWSSDKLETKIINTMYYIDTIEDSLEFSVEKKESRICDYTTFIKQANAILESRK